MFLAATPDYGELALRELAQAAPDAHPSAVMPGLWAVAGVPFGELAARFRAAPPVFVRHVCPVDAGLVLEGSDSDIAAIADAAAALAHRLSPERTFSVQVRLVEPTSALTAFALSSRAVERIGAVSSAPRDVRAPRDVVSIVVHRDRAYVGLSDVRDNLSSWAGGAHHFARRAGQLSRAEFKLLEALETFDVRLEAGGRVLDLGAAPGGWTRVLRERGQEVTAVDPARLHPSLRADAGVRHVATTAESFLARAEGRFAGIFDDIRQEPRQAAALMRRAAGSLAPSGVALVTLKLRRRERLEQIDAALAELRQSYGLCRARQLFHNRSEVTVWLARPVPR